MSNRLSDIRVDERRGERAVVRDIQAIPYRWTSAYKRALATATRQRANMHYRVETLWAWNVGQATSGMLRRPAGAIG